MRNLRTKKWLQSVIMAVLLPSVSLVTMPVMGNPTGGVVVNGNVQFHNPNANTLQINQSSNLAIIDWQDFSIGVGETTQFVQPSASATVLNRVVTGNPSAIYGSLLANGNVFVVNPNGIVVGAGGVIDVGGSFVASTLDISNNDFLSGGPNRFYGDSQTGITNFGTISSRNGDVILMGGFVDNQGQIGALNGAVALSSGGDILVSESGGSTITIQGGSDYNGIGINNDGEIRGSSAELKAHGNVYALAINNGGAVRANGASRSNGRVRLSASGSSSNINLGDNSSLSARSGANGGDVVVDAGSEGNVSLGGSIEVEGQTRGGTVSVIGRNVDQRAGSVISADGMVNAGSIAFDGVETTTVSGTLTSEGTFGDGGFVDVKASEVSLSSTASVSVDGYSVGGRIRVGGEFQGQDVEGFREADNTSVAKGAKLTADSDGGNAGSVIVWANNDTTFLGDVSASATGVDGNGGLIEISGKNGLYAYGKIRATSVNGRSGAVLFDPDDLFVGNFGGTGVGPGTPENPLGSNIEVALINDTLQSGTSVILATQSGNIFFQDIDIAGQNGGGGSNITSGELTNPDLDGVGGVGAFVDTRTGDWDMSDPNHPRNYSIQWTNSNASFAAFASESIRIENHIRTSGAGSINLIAGWGGTESDGILVNALINNDPEAAWDFYLDAGQFGQNGGSIVVGDQNSNRHVSVGSRFGNTNLAGAVINIIASDIGSESNWTQIGFSDSGQIFAPRFNRTDNNAYDFDLNNRTLEEDDNPVVGIAGNEYGQEVDIDGDGIADGVYGINYSGVLDATNTETGGDATFIPYAIHYNSSRVGNWWWHHIDADSPDPAGLGGLRPEHGAGVGQFSAVAKATGAQERGANINVVSLFGVNLTGGGRHGNSAIIGHGGDASGWADQRSLVNSGVEQGQTLRTWSINGASNDRVSTSIARLAPVYGNINVLAGVDPTTVTYNRFAGTIDAEVTRPGSVVLTAQQRLGPGNAPTNPNDGGAGVGVPVLIGHGGIGQFGSFNGDIDVRAGTDVLLLAGSHTRSFAQIGHSNSDFMYWDPTNNADQQIRFFASTSDFRDPLLRRGKLFDTDSNIDQDAAGDTYVNPNNGNPGNSGRSADYQLSNPNAVAGPIVVDALDGSVLKEMTGDINVEARTGKVIVRAFNTPDQSDGIDGEIDGNGTIDSNSPADGITRTTERRFAKIGHGGTGRAFWAEEAGYTSNRSDRFQELVNFRIDTGTGDNTGSNSVIGEVGDSLNRSATFMSLIGDISVTAGGDVEITGGNDHFDFAQIGHGGHELADYETSGIVGGNIDVIAGGNLLIEAGGRVDYTGNANGRHQRASAHLGHGGYRPGFMGYFGDITVDVEGDITLIGGSYGDSYAKIGHLGKDDWAQVAGTYLREENYFFDGVSTDIETSVNGNDVTIQYTNVTGDPEDDNLDVTQNFTLTSRTANITVDAGGDITMSHLAPYVQKNDNQVRAGRTNNNVIDDAFVQIGHGGQNVDALRDNNTAANFDDKIGDITVTAGNNIALFSGAGDGYYTRIGHGGGDEDRVDNTNTEAMILGGRVTLTAGNDITLDGEGEYADHNGTGNLTFEFENDLRNIGSTGYGIPSRNNPIQVGHGGVFNNLDIVVLDVGDRINGIDANSTITVTAMNDISLKGGVGAVAPAAVNSETRRNPAASHVQIGHGFASDLANDAARLNNIPTGFTGDIYVSAGRDLSLAGSRNAWSFTPDDDLAETLGAAAFIGNGGYNLDAPSAGDITVYAGRDLKIVGSQRVDNNASISEGGLNFAKIGHMSVENGASRYDINNATGGVSDDDAVNFADQEGDIVVVVGRDLTMQGGDLDVQQPRFPALGAQPEVFTSFAQIGHGGPAISGNLNGDITVLVQGNLITIDGFTEATNRPAEAEPSNNYVMIGHGDWLRDSDTFNDLALISRRPARGDREGNIVVAVGESAFFDHTLVGHADPAVRNGGSTLIGSGTTQIAVSRNFPFYGGTGVLEAINGSVFTSANYGGEELQFFLPARSNNFMDGTTRINQLFNTFDDSLNDMDFVGLDPSQEERAGRGDEVYLRPDLWWQSAEGIELTVALEYDASGVFPTDPAFIQGGAVALVEAPGGIENMTNLIAGSLGASADIYRGASSTSSGLYNLYYDAIEPVATELPTPPIPPLIFDPFNFSPFTFPVFLDSDSFFRGQEGEDGLFGDEESLFALLGIEEAFGEGDDDPQTPAERGLDSLLGSSRTPFSDEEEEEEERREDVLSRRNSGPGGLTFYAFNPSTNRYSSYRVFGTGR